MAMAERDRRNQYVIKVNMGANEFSEGVEQVSGLRKAAVMPESLVEVPLG